jgi:hypothetical protein
MNKNVAERKNITFRASPHFSKNARKTTRLFVDI